MPNTAHRPPVLLLHDGELADVAELLSELGAPVAEWTSADGQPEEGRWELVVGSAPRLLELDRAVLRAALERVAVLTEDARGSDLELTGVGIDYAVRRPIHPTALRLLLLHLLYRGPERRRAPRARVVASVHFRAGLRKRPALLADLSLEGCRLLTDHAVGFGRRLTLYLSEELGGARTLALGGRVMRVGPATGEQPGTEALTVAFGPLAPIELAQLRRVLAAHGRAPAGAHALPPSAALELDAPATADTAGGAQAAAPEVGDRRTDTRRTFEHRVIARGEAAARVLLGRDLSYGGMRVEPHPDLLVGQGLELALHTGDGRDPLVVQAHVDRDDGDEGFVLRFHGLSEAAEQYLAQMVDGLPIFAPDRFSPHANLVVSEIVG